MPLYFAFGSNIDRAQMAQRCPGAEPVGLATLRDHRLVFRGPSRKRGGGVLSVDPAPDEGVQGLLYEVTASHLAALDRYEGAPEWYERVTRQVHLAAGEARDAILYRLPVHVRQMPPTQAYLAQVSAAFAAHDLDAEPLHTAAQAPSAQEPRDG